ncbi:MAG: S1C family serine protease [Stellaceae bacterium]
MLPRIVLALALVLVASPALAAAPDRSGLSYEDNVTINAACYAASMKGEDAFQACVAQQMAALAHHPSPDRTGLSAVEAREVAEDCIDLRRQGVAQYNDCLTKAVAAAAPAAADGDANDALAGTAMLAHALVTDETSAPKPPDEAKLPLPRAELPPLPHAANDAAMTAAQLYKLVERSVFVVAAARSPGDARARQISQGSAVAVAPHLLLTNCHVVDHRPMIVLLQDEETWRAKLVAADLAADRCVLEADGPALTPVPGVRPFADIVVGEPVFALGAPHALERTMTGGLVSGRREIKGRNMIQTSAPVSPGSSGGGLFDARGNLLGITTLASLPGWQNLNFAVAAADFWE